MVGYVTAGRSRLPQFNSGFAQAGELELREMNAKPDTRLQGDVARAWPRVAVLIPCFNEAIAIGRTVGDFRAALPDADVYVYDNNSTDGTVAVARAAGAIVRCERRQGKGAVVRR